MNYSISYILGWVLTIESIFMFIPCIVAAIHREKEGFAFIVNVFVQGLTSFQSERKQNRRFYAKEGFILR